MQIITVASANVEELYKNRFSEFAKISLEQFKKIPFIFTQYYNTYDIRVFVSKRPLKLQKKSSNEFEVTK
jgi:hypothetical protein